MESRSNVITVTETVSDKVVADTVRITLSAVGESEKYGDASAKADSVADGAVAALKSADIDVRMLGVNVSAVYSAERRVSGYRAVRTFVAEFAHDRERLAGALDALESSNCEWRISFALKDNSTANALLARAVKSARAAAEAIAVAAGATLGSFSKAEYTANDSASPVMYMRASANAASDIEPELITVTETVTCSWEIERRRK